MSKRYILLILAMLFLISACGDPNYHEESDTGSVSFNLTLQDAPALSSESKPEISDSVGVREAIQIDCTASSISYIEALIYDSNNSLLKSGLWSCSAHSGTISGITAGTNRKAVILAYDSGWNIKSGGEEAGITITAGQTTASNITVTTFVPTGVSASAGNGQVTISWNSVPGATSYNIYWATSSSMASSSSYYTANKITGISTTSYTHTGRTNDTTYYYVVTALNSSWEGSSDSSTVSATPTIPAPTDVSATGGNEQVTVSWSSVSGATSYNIYWSTSSGVSKTSYSGKISNVTSPYTHTGRTNDTTYYYIVTALESYWEESSASSTVSATPTTPSISAPDLGDAVDNTSLSWITGGYANWFKQNVVYYSGGYAAQSGYIGNSENTYIQTTVTGPGTLKFYWKVSCSYSDDLYFYIDGAEQSAIYGEVGWTQKIYAIPSGSHTLKWAFIRTSYSSSSGSNAGWLDKVEFTPQ